ncbi:MAG TPA: BrxA/BrxB family bacilliredoxin, partial [Gemmatimonadales bacterium]|nr:BrxA/BrxB family bacilliredoxin [Gemmatimonadales bacterium]
MYSELMVRPMREEMTRMGAQELKTVAEVDATLGAGEGTMLVFVNSVCGCAAAGARPALSMALKHGTKPSKVVTVFAGVDTEATQRARSFFS